jgi:hypothetical protein
MTKRAISKELPEPGHPFARWCAGAIVSLWALGAQYFPDPWNKLGAILSPGAGYIFGQALDFIIIRVSNTNFRRTQQRNLLENKKSEDDLYKERQNALRYGADSKIIAEIDAAIFSLQRNRIYVIAQLAGLNNTALAVEAVDYTKGDPGAPNTRRVGRQASIRGNAEGATIVAGDGIADKKTTTAAGRNVTIGNSADDITIVTGDGNAVLTTDRSKIG